MESKLETRKSTKVRLHGSNVHDEIIAHVLSVDAQTNKQANQQTDAEDESP